MGHHLHDLVEGKKRERKKEEIGQREAKRREVHEQSSSGGGSTRAPRERQREMTIRYTKITRALYVANTNDKQ
jgi:hypothetical protein